MGRARVQEVRRRAEVQYVATKHATCTHKLKLKFVIQNLLYCRKGIQKIVMILLSNADCAEYGFAKRQTSFIFNFPCSSGDNSCRRFVFQFDIYIFSR